MAISPWMELTKFLSAALRIKIAILRGYLREAGRLDSRRLPSADKIALFNEVGRARRPAFAIHFPPTAFGTEEPFHILASPSILRFLFVLTRDRYCELAHYVSCHCTTAGQLLRQLPPRTFVSTLNGPSRLYETSPVPRAPFIRFYIYRFVSSIITWVKERPECPIYF